MKETDNDESYLRRIIDQVGVKRIDPIITPDDLFQQGPALRLDIRFPSSIIAVVGWYGPRGIGDAPDLKVIRIMSLCPARLFHFGQMIIYLSHIKGYRSGQRSASITM